MNEKRKKQKEEEKVNKDRKMRSETIILRPEVPLLERLSTYANLYINKYARNIITR